MPKAYAVVAYRSISNPQKLAAYSSAAYGEALKAQGDGAVRDIGLLEAWFRHPRPIGNRIRYEASSQRSEEEFPQIPIRHQRLGSGRALVLLQLERKRDVNATREDGERTDQPDNCQRARAGLGKHDNAKGNRQQAAQSEQPFAFDFLAQPDRTPDLQHTDDNCPTSDEHQQYQRGHAWPNESQ